LFNMKLRRESFIDRQSHWSILALAGVLALVGCGGEKGPQRASIRGKVTFDGAPVGRGMIVFLPADGNGPSSGAEIKEGAYTIPESTGPVAGAHRVEITATREGGSQTVEGIGGAAAGGPSGAYTGPSAVMYIPAAYNRESTLKQEIKLGDNELNFDLKATP